MPGLYQMILLCTKVLGDRGAVVRGYCDEGFNLLTKNLPKPTQTYLLFMA